jgi:hypothetical protein
MRLDALGTLQVIAILGCRPRLPIANTFRTPEEVKAAVLREVPIGMSTEVAKSVMLRSLFTCREMVNEPWGVGPWKGDYLHCDRYDPAGFPVKERWQVALIEEGGRISEVHVAGGLVGP